MKIKQSAIQKAGKTAQDLIDEAEARYQKGEVNLGYVDDINEMMGLINSLCYASDNGGSIMIERDSLEAHYRERHFDRLLDAQTQARFGE